MRCPWCCSGPGSGSSRTRTGGTVSDDRVPARTSSLSRQTSVPQPSACPRKVPFNIGPPEITTAGRSTLAAAISSAGIVLSQPPSSTSPSIGLARNISSIAIAAMFRQSMAVGRTRVSPSETTGRFSGTPPASYTPCLHRVGHLVEMGVAGREVGGGVGDRDLRSALERAGRHPAPHPGPVEVRVPIVAGVPLPAAQLPHQHALPSVADSLRPVRHGTRIVRPTPPVRSSA